MIFRSRRVGVSHSMRKGLGSDAVASASRSHHLTSTVVHFFRFPLRGFVGHSRRRWKIVFYHKWGRVDPIRRQLELVGFGKAWASGWRSGSWPLSPEREREEVCCCSLSSRSNHLRPGCRCCPGQYYGSWSIVGLFSYEEEVDMSWGFVFRWDLSAY